MKVNADGSFGLLTGTQDLGTGTKTVMTQIAAEELGVSPDRIRITIGDTLSCPYSLLSAGSLTVPPAWWESSKLWPLTSLAES